MIRLAAGMSRLGTESAFEVLARAQALAAAGRPIINLCIGQPDFPAPAHVTEAANRALAAGHHGYTPAPGIPGLRAAIAADAARRSGTPVDPDCVTVTPGSKVALFYALLMLGEPGAEIVYPSPSYPGYESILGFTGATGVPFILREEDNFAFRADDILQLITPRTRLIILNSPANPTGGVTVRAELDRLVKGLEAHPHVAVLSDEIYGRIVYDGAEHISLLSYASLRDRVIVLDGFSKGFAMTGWRVGYGIWPKSLVEHAVRIAINCHSCVNSAAQYGAIAALEGPQDPLEAMNTAFAARRKVIVEGLNQVPGVSCVWPGGAFYAFPNVGRLGLPSAVLAQRLMEEAGVAILAGTAFGAAGQGHLRFSYAASIEAIETALSAFTQLAGRIEEEQGVLTPAHGRGNA